VFEYAGVSIRTQGRVPIHFVDPGAFIPMCSNNWKHGLLNNPIGVVKVIRPVCCDHKSCGIIREDAGWVYGITRWRME
jgi:hypothetical protein